MARVVGNEQQKEGTEFLLNDKFFGSDAPKIWKTTNFWHYMRQNFEKFGLIYDIFR